MKITTTLTISGAVALALGLTPLALAQSPAASTATPPAMTAQAPTSGTHEAAPSPPPVTASKSEIRQAQQALVRLGYSINVDGMMGPQTRAALRKFQNVNGIPQTGRLDTDTKRGLGLIGGQPPAGLNLGGYTTSRIPTTGQAAGPSNAMPMSTSGMPQRQGMQSMHQGMPTSGQTMGSKRQMMLSKQQIMQVQRALNQKGYHIPVTGTWGRQSRQALMTFQRKNNLNVTGYPDRATIQALGLMRNPSQTSAPSPATY